MGPGGRDEDERTGRCDTEGNGRGGAVTMCTGKKGGTHLLRSPLWLRNLLVRDALLDDALLDLYRERAEPACVIYQLVGRKEHGEDDARAVQARRGVAPLPPGRDTAMNKREEENADGDAGTGTANKART